MPLSIFPISPLSTTMYTFWDSTTKNTASHPHRLVKSTKNIIKSSTHFKTYFVEILQTKWHLLLYSVFRRYSLLQVLLG